MADTVPKFFIQTLQDGSVIDKKLAPESVITSKIKDGNVTPSKLDSTGTYDFTSALLAVATPTTGANPTTKDYVDTEIASKTTSWKESCRAATTFGLSSTFSFDSATASGTFTAGAAGALAIDSVSLAAGDRVLVRRETGANRSRNGIYVVRHAGSGTANAVLQRSDDCNDTSTNLKPGFSVFINEGATFADTVFGLTTNAPIVLNATDLIFVQQAHISELTAGDGLTKTGTTIDVDNGDGLTFDGAQKLTLNLTGSTLTNGAGGLGVDAGEGLTDGGSGLDVDLATNGGLSFDASKLKVNVGDGVSLSGAGAVQTDPGQGLENNAGKIRAKLGNGIGFSGTDALEADLGDGLQFDGSNQIQVNAGNGLAIVGGQVQAKLGNGINLDGSGNLQADLGNGLQFNVGDIEAVGGDGIAVGGSGIAVDLGTNPGLEIAASKLKALVDTTKGLELTASGIAVKVGSNMSFDGSGNLQSSGGGGGGSVTGGAGIDVTGSVASVDLATNGGLITAPGGANGQLMLDQLNIPALTFKHSSAGGGTQPALIVLKHDASTPAADTGAHIPWLGNTASATGVSFAEIRSKLNNISANNEQSDMIFSILTSASGGSKRPVLALRADQEVVIGSLNTGVIGTRQKSLTIIDKSRTDTNTETQALSLFKTTSGTAATGYGTGIDYSLENASGSYYTAGLQHVTTVNATANSETTSMTFEVMDSGSMVMPLEVQAKQVYTSKGVRYYRRQVSGTTNLLMEDHILGCQTSGGAVTINLPAASSIASGSVFVIKDESGNAGSANISLVPNGSDTIDGASGTYAIAVNSASINLYSTGSNWHIY